MLRIENHGRGERESPFTLQAAHFATPFHRIRAGRQRHLGPFGEFLGITSKTGDNLALGVEDLDAVVRPVAHIHIAIRVYGHVGRTVQLALSGPVAAELAHELAIRGELLHAVVLVVGDVHVPLPVYGDPRGAVELTVIAPSRAPVPQEIAILIEDGDAVEPLVGDVHASLAIERDACRPNQLPRAVAGAGEIGHKLLIARLRSDGELTHAGPELGPVIGYVLDLLPSP